MEYRCSASKSYDCRRGNEKSYCFDCDKKSYGNSKKNKLHHSVKKRGFSKYSDSDSDSNSDSDIDHHRIKKSEPVIIYKEKPVIIYKEKESNSQPSIGDKLSNSIKSDSAISSDDDSNACIICSENKKIVALIPCGHICYCVKCCLETSKNKPECPICRKEYKDILITFNT